MSIEIVSMKTAFEDILTKCAELYCEVWRESPWNEDFWQPQDVLADIRQQIMFSHAYGYVALERGEVIGFTWGYGVTAESMREISGGCSFDEVASDAMFYIDELGVASSHRQYGIGRQLSETMLAELKTGGFSSVFLRTDIKAEAARTLYHKLGFVDLAIVDQGHPDRTYWQLIL